MAWRNGFRITGPLTTQFMMGQFYQTGHQKHLLQGNTSRNPAYKFQYFTNAPIITSLAALQTGHTLSPRQQLVDRSMATQVLDFFNIQYLVVRPYQYAKFDGQKNITVTHQAVIPYIENTLRVEKIYDQADGKIYRVNPGENSSLKSELQINTTNPLAPLYFGEGWGLLTPGQPITALRRQARLMLPLTGLAQRIALRLRLPDGYSGPLLTVSLRVNSWQSSTQAVGWVWQDLTFDLPAGVASPGLNDVWLQFDQVMAAPEPEAQTEIWTPDVTVLSAGEEVGDLGHIFVNGRDVSPNLRGYNLALLQPDGSVLQVANFDTHFDLAASAAMAQFLAAAPADAIIAAAVADEASANLSAEAVQVLQALGVTADLHGCFRCSHAFIRQADGTILEAHNAWRPVGLTTRLGLTEPAVAAEMSDINIVTVEK
jgi:hypothetical protein